MKTNCWEFKKCGREPGGSTVEVLGVCPAATEQRLDGIHGGKSAGRACWVIAGTFCKGEVQGTFARKTKDCGKCDFYLKVREEEGSGLIRSYVLLELIGWTREKLILELQKALDEIERLSGLLPICAWCKKIRNDKGQWLPIEVYISEHSNAKFSHGACPECYKKIRNEELDP